MILIIFNTLKPTNLLIYIEKKKKIEAPTSGVYLFWMGFAPVGGAFLKLCSTAFLGSSMADLPFPETESAMESTILLLSKLFLSISSSPKQNEELIVKIWIRIRRKMANPLNLKPFFFISLSMFNKWNGEDVVL